MLERDVHWVDTVKGKIHEEGVLGKSKENLIPEVHCGTHEDGLGTGPTLMDSNLDEVAVPPEKPVTPSWK